MLWDEPKIFFLERRYFFSIILSEFLKNRVALQRRWIAMEYLMSFLVSVGAQVIGHFLCKWLDPDDEKGE